MPDLAEREAQRAVERLKSDTRKLGSEDMNALADHARYIDTEHMTPDDQKAIIDGMRKCGADKNGNGTLKTDKEIIEDAKSDAGRNLTGTNIIFYNSRQLHERGLDPEVTLAHELGHKGIERGYISLEPGHSNEFSFGQCGRKDHQPPACC